MRTPFPSNITKDQSASVKHCPSDVTMKELRATGDHLIWGMPSVRTGPGQDALRQQIRMFDTTDGRGHLV